MFLCVLEVVRDICTYAWAGHLCPSTWNVTKHGSQSPSLMGVNWVSDGVSIDFCRVYVS